ncbi:MAG TPA: GNAT family N-acetyltransferase [Bryobacteraceae bacterium]|nr:GNAT family N-acetyltransferase [Bryobacteraceae bacterium]
MAGRPEAVAGVELGLELYPAGEWDRVAEKWERLLASAPRPSFFLSRRWVETWMEVFGPRLETSIAVLEYRDTPVAACLLVQSRRKYGLVPLRRISLNASGENPEDTTYVEFNDLVCLPGWEEPVVSRLAEHLSAEQWDEFSLDGFLPGRAYDAVKRAFARFDLEETRQPSYYVDLAALRRMDLTYDGMLNSHRRRMVRQNIRAFSKLGPLILEVAQTTEAAIQMLGELALLNRERFARDGGHSAFESAAFLEFHRKLIQKRQANGGVQLLRLKAGGNTIGIVYNLVSAGKVCFYQCGFNYGLNPKLSPGIATLAQAIPYCLNQGYDDFDFLSGEANYKRMLSTGSRELVWAVFRRRSAAIRSMTAARTAKRHLQRLLRSSK